MRGHQRTSEFIDMKFAWRDQAQVLRDVEQRGADAPFAYIVTPNVDHVVRIQHARSDLWPMYRNAWITLCDSRILGRLAARADMALPIVPGSDLTVALFREVIRPDDRIAVIGGSSGAIDKLRQTFGLTNLAHHNPPMGFIHDAGATQDAEQFAIEARARYTFIAVGSPQQEILAYRIGRTGQATGVGLCVGASLQFLTDEQTRAPRIVQRMCMEWLFRLLSDPKRLWRRYLVEGPLIFEIARQWRLRSAA
ncbi:glycosyltransferase [Novosphingobium barchaimii LL02]|uniref:Glycosyltransferase n=2 Tax=Novosphingobium barchaimii TaxID=1420591 RepID=A0A0J7XXY0_9SPHN|nr:glycosyltransferase [Novosphingobium barchaimii LL02]